MAKAEDLSVLEALAAVLSGVSRMPARNVPILEALGRVLAEPIVANDDLPPFANSSMDGYAVCASDVSQASASSPASLRVVGDIAAGTMTKITIQEGSSARIMTGAVMPAGADAVVPVEQTDEPWRDPDRPLPGVVKIYEPVTNGDYVRLPGEDITTGTEVLPAGRVIRPQEIAILAALGHSTVSVIGRPKVAILATGDELVPITESLSPGKIRNSNNYALAAQVLSLGAEPIILGIAADTETDVRARLQEGLKAGVDLFVSSAGVSVGAYDVVKVVLEQEANVRFWRVRMRPGKPLAVGTYGGRPYLGLPGNPVSALVSFERFARPALLKMAGYTNWLRPIITVNVQDDIHSDGRESYLRAIVGRNQSGYWAKLTGGQGSHMMTSLVKANALIIVPEGAKSVTAGEQLQAMMIDWPETVF